jgi:c-di-GMP-binding flagellar brake protein YcgR
VAEHPKSEQWNQRERRRRKRTQVVCSGEYLVIDGGPSTGWEPCELLDLSMDGAALATRTGELHRGEQILLRLPGEPPETPAVLDLRAVVINRRTRTDPHVFGLTFPALTPMEKKALLRIVIGAYRQAELSR